MRTRRQHRRAVGHDGPSASRARKRAGAGDVAAAESERGIVAVQEVALDELAKLFAVFGREFPRGHEAVACRLQRLVHGSERRFARLREELPEGVVQAVEKLFLPMALRA